ncbi:MAG: DNA primase [Planctomycetaceae bacterium]|nr:DNA primase [Planctomycetaceae bacterium]
MVDEFVSAIHPTWFIFLSRSEVRVSAEQSNDFKETVRASTDIVGLIGETVRLNSVRGGREFVGLCPFHDDHNPSMRVYPDQQSFRCWVCNMGGDCFTFVMESEHVEFRDALEILAQRANVPIPARSQQRPGQPGLDKAKLLEALLWAQGVFQQTLKSVPAAEPARRYLAQRGFTQETIEQFRLGFAPDEWSKLLDQARGRFTPQQLLSVGLVRERENGSGHYDYFRDRVMFPIHNERGQPVGFGGRVLPGADASFGKYFNSNENAVFHKSRLVYALNQAREAMKATNTVVVTEGYTDCITLHQAGLRNVVATLGTALTEMQVTTIKRFAQRVVLVYDGDDAGQSASERAVSRFLAQDVDLRILTLPAGEDPADFVTQHGPERMQQMIHDAPEAFDFVFNMSRNRHGLQTVDGRQRILGDVVSLLAGVPRLAKNVREDLLLHRTAERLNLSEEVVREQYRQARQGTPQRNVQSVNTTHRVDRPETPASVMRILQGQPTRDDRFECDLLECLISAPEWITRVRQEIGTADFTNPSLRTIAESCFDIDELGEETLAFGQLLSALDGNEPAKRLAVWIGAQASTKQIEYKLREAEATNTESNTTDDCPLLLRRSLENFKWRREEQSHQRRVLELSEQCEGSRSLDDETEKLLRQFSDFHQKRASKKATG